MQPVGSLVVCCGASGDSEMRSLGCEIVVVTSPDSPEPRAGKMFCILLEVVGSGH